MKTLQQKPVDARRGADLRNGGKKVLTAGVKTQAPSLSHLNKIEGILHFLSPRRIYIDEIML